MAWASALIPQNSFHTANPSHIAHKSRQMYTVFNLYREAQLGQWAFATAFVHAYVDDVGVGIIDLGREFSEQAFFVIDQHADAAVRATSVII